LQVKPFNSIVFLKMFENFLNIKNITLCDTKELLGVTHLYAFFDNIVVWLGKFMNVQTAKKLLPAELMQNVIILQYTTKWPLFTIKKLIGYQIKEK
jgi:hypothetical protein